MKVVCKDGRVLHLTHEEQELRDFVLCQVTYPSIIYRIVVAFYHYVWNVDPLSRFNCFIVVILFQIAQHHVNTVQHLAKIVGWHVLSINSHLGTGNMEPMGNAHSILLSSPRGDR